MSEGDFNLKNARDFLDEAVDRLQLLHDCFAFATPNRWELGEQSLCGLCYAIDDIIDDISQGDKGIEAAKKYYGDKIIVSDLKQERDVIESGAFGLHANLEKLNDLIERIDSFLEKDVMEIRDLKSYFEEKRIEISRLLLGKQDKKRASATLPGQAKAQKADTESVSPN